MSSDLIAGIVAIALGIVVVGLGLRRNLGETTRNWLPQAGEASAWTTATAGAPGVERRRRPLSPRQRRWMIGCYLLMSLGFAVFAVVSAHERLFNAILAATFGLGAVVFWLRRSP
jgi:predicted lysophospholipase L1 biosynthesis ABC-type transport system permease subunit